MKIRNGVSRRIALVGILLSRLKASIEIKDELRLAIVFYGDKS